MGNQCAQLKLLLAKKYGISSDKALQDRAKLASLNDRINASKVNSIGKNEIPKLKRWPFTPPLLLPVF